MEQGAAGLASRALLLASGALLACALVASCDGSPSGAQPIVVSTPKPTSTPESSPTPGLLRVHVSGAVDQPNQVRLLPFGSIVQDAIDAAGGPTDEADLERMNLALELADQQHVHVPAVGEEDAPPAVSGGAGGDGQSGGLININTATQAELETLPGIGPAKAEDIIAYREANGPYGRIQDIQNVPGIGEKTFEALQELITVQ